MNQLWPRNPRKPALSLPRRRLLAGAGGPTAGRGVPRNHASEHGNAVGGFDEQFFPVWFEDVDLCQRLLENGGKIVYCPAARFRHSGAHSVGQLKFRDKQMFWYTKHAPLRTQAFFQRPSSDIALRNHRGNVVALACCRIRRSPSSTWRNTIGILGGDTKSEIVHEGLGSGVL